MRAHVIAIVAASLALGAPAPARAEDADALAHLDRGVRAFRAGDFQRARRELLAAHRLAPDRANPYRWLALTEVQLGDCPAALGHIADFTARVPPDDPRLAELERLRELCRRPPPRARRPLHRRWWFWAALTGATAAAAGTTYLLVRDPDPAILPPIACGPSGCTP